MGKQQEKIKEELHRIAMSKGYENLELLDDRCRKDSFDKFYRFLADQELVTEEEYIKIVSSVSGVNYFNLKEYQISKESAEMIEEDVALKYNVFPVSMQGNRLTLAVSDPFDIIMFDDLKRKLSKEIDFVLSGHDSIAAAIEHLYKGDGDFFNKIEDEAGDQLNIEEYTQQQSEETDDGDQAPIVKLVDLIVTESLTRRASDIHIEPMKDALRVRYRVDGVLHTIHTIPKKNQNAVISRLKIVSGLNITENRIPQDGRFKIRLKKKEVDFRVSSLPTRHGEKFVLRALDKANLNVGLETSGFSAIPLKLFQKALTRPYGIMLVTGPTGSGKSTTLYSVLNRLNTVDKHIITIEDPVEYQVDGMTQIPINHEINMTFASALRAVLRQSPDVVMVGEIRDSETADIAIKASLTGQFILSTLHTNDSIGAITRLIDMGTEPFLLASSLVMTSAQRLCRKICPNCRVPYDAADKVFASMGIAPSTQLYMGRGCDKCGGSGYSGREAVLEVLLVDEQVADMIVRRASEKEIADYARKNLDFRTLREDVVDKCARGVTTVEEVFRITS